jgi:hypothetical protein
MRCSWLFAQVETKYRFPSKDIMRIPFVGTERNGFYALLQSVGYRGIVDDDDDEASLWESVSMGDVVKLDFNPNKRFLVMGLMVDMLKEPVRYV